MAAKRDGRIDHKADVVPSIGESGRGFAQRLRRKLGLFDLLADLIVDACTHVNHMYLVCLNGQFSKLIFF
jgi:hypothetical protein